MKVKPELKWLSSPEMERAFIDAFGDDVFSLLLRASDVLERFFAGNMSQLARDLGMAQSSVYRTFNPDLETKRATVKQRLHTLGDKLADQMGISLDWYERGVGEPPWELIKERPHLKRLPSKPTSEPKLRARPEREEASAYVEHRYAAGGVGAGDARVQWDEGETVRTPREVMLSWTGGRAIPRDQGWWTKVRGTSMEPWLPDGTPIFVERTDVINGGGRYILWLDDEDAEVVKRVERLGKDALLLISDNTAHPTRQLRRLEEADDLHTYFDETYNITVRVMVKGRVIFPADTPHAILRTITSQIAAVFNPAAR